MARPIPLGLSPRDLHEELQSRVERAPGEHAEAVLAAYEVLQALYDRKILELLRGVVGASDRILEGAIEAADAPESVRALRNLLLLAKALGTVEPELFAGFTEAIPKALVPANLQDPTLWSVMKAFWNRDFRRGLGAVNGFLETLGRHLAAQKSG